MKYFIGVDPGAAGAIAVIHPDGTLTTFRLDKEDITCSNAQEFLRALPSDRTFVAIENLHALFNVSASSTFALGWACGYWHGAFDSLRFPIEIVSPKQWQEEITVPVEKPEIPKGLPAAEIRKIKDRHKKAVKLESIRTANELFPGYEILHDGVADAVCIAAWRRYRWLLQGEENESST